MRQTQQPHINLLLAALINVDVVSHWSEEEWGLALRQARAANMVATLADKVQQNLSVDKVPGSIAKHFEAARNVLAQRNSSVRWECEQLRDSLASQGVSPIFLKGAAYLVAGLPLSENRYFSDIDVMVPAQRLSEVEIQLMLSGWLTVNNDPYDQHYYRKWMHEVPPLRHIHRGTSLDLHHAISPRTAKYQPRTELIFMAAVPAQEISGAYVLSPADMILHAATHLFSDGESEMALRNLVDIAELLSFFQRDDGFNRKLADRAFEVGLDRPLYYAAHFIEKVLRQNELQEIKGILESAAPCKPALRFLEAVYLPVFEGNHPTVWSSMTKYSRMALFLRGQWLRMPAHLLIPHLLHKVIRGLASKPKVG